MRGDFVLALWRDRQRRGIGIDPAFPSQVTDEGPQRGHLAGDRRARLSLAVELREKAADQRQVEMLRLKRVALSSLLGRKGNELRQVAVVRRHRVGGRVAIQADVVEKAAELFHRSRSSRARSDVASFRSARPSFLPFRCPGGVP